MLSPVATILISVPSRPFSSPAILSLRLSWAGTVETAIFPLLPKRSFTPLAITNPTFCSLLPIYPRAGDPAPVLVTCITLMPESNAFWIAGKAASVEWTCPIPAGFLIKICSIVCTWPSTSNPAGPTYEKLTPKSSAASWAPFFKSFQKGWVATIETITYSWSLLSFNLEPCAWALFANNTGAIAPNAAPPARNFLLEFIWSKVLFFDIQTSQFKFINISFII